MNKFIAGIRLLRPLNCLTGAVVVFVAAAITHSLDHISLLLTAMAVVMFYNGGANAINDYYDYEIDKINRPDRPLSSGMLTKKTGLLIAISLFILGTLLAIQLNTIAMLIAILLAMPILIFYTIGLKNRPLIGNMAVALILGLVFIFAGAVFESIAIMIVPAVLAFLLTFLREVIKDVEDMEGDNKMGLRTFPIVAGTTATYRIVRWWAFFTGLIMLLPVWYEYYTIQYLWIVLIGINLPLLYIITKFSFEPDMKTVSLSAKLLKISTIAGVIAVYFGSV
ncbi:MAG: UbiA family prenyltransferase [Candidatus Marinimicrobia bacterium]|nr:UbiA family prenyltransferase [Candidatus Neomarinimicrobiota bacterium]